MPLIQILPDNWTARMIETSALELQRPLPGESLALLDDAELT